MHDGRREAEPSRKRGVERPVARAAVTRIEDLARHDRDVDGIVAIREQHRERRGRAPAAFPRIRRLELRIGRNGEVDRRQRDDRRRRTVVGRAHEDRVECAARADADRDEIRFAAQHVGVDVQEAVATRERRALLARERDVGQPRRRAAVDRVRTQFDRAVEGESVPRHDCFAGRAHVHDGLFARFDANESQHARRPRVRSSTPMHSNYP